MFFCAFFIPFGFENERFTFFSLAFGSQSDLLVFIVKYRWGDSELSIVGCLWVGRDLEGIQGCLTFRF